MSGTSMRILIVNDNPAINTIIEEILQDEGHTIRGVMRLDDAEREMETFRPEIIVIDEVVDSKDSMLFVDKIDPESKVKLLVLTNGKRPLPKDKPMIVGVIHKPFKAAEIIDSVRMIRDGPDYIPSTARVSDAPKKSRRIFGKNEVRKEETPEEEEFIIRFGRSYLVFEEVPGNVYDVAKEFIRQGVDIFVLSFERPKGVQNKLGDDKAEVVSISPKGKLGLYEDASKLGTIMSKIMRFIDQSVRPAVIIDDLTQLIEANDINRVLMLLVQIFTGREKTFSVAVSVKENQFTDKDKILLYRYMERYVHVEEEEQPPEEE